ncbi:MAG TPA: SCO family protein, partial [Candidatus Obscuribacterales bacterium]
EMQKLQQAFAAHPDVRLLSFSVDPATDTPDRLRKYADKYGADPQRWLFATGRIENLYQLASASFHLVPPGQPGPAPFLHTPRFALVDDRLQIRGYYDSTDPVALRTLIEKDLPQLLPH